LGALCAVCVYLEIKEWVLRHVRMLGLCLVAVFAVGGVAATCALADGGPESDVPGYYHCVKAKKVGKAYTGQYGEKECKTVVCKKDKDRGEIISENEVVLETITFEDCLANGEKSRPCGNVSAETIETDPQEGLLVWLNEARTEAGILLAGEQFASFKCGSEAVEVDGFVEGTATLGGKKGPTITFAVNAGKQAERTFVLAGVQGPFNLYTEPKAGEQIESTLESVEAQKGPASIY
jgi:hypothetical protein